MAITLEGTNGLFTRLGKMGVAWDSLVTYRLTTAPALFKAVMDTFDSTAMTSRDTIAGLNPALISGAKGMASMQQAIKNAAQAMLIRMVQNDNPQPTLRIQDALAELIKQMRAGSETLKANVVSATLAAGSANVGTGAFVASVLDGSGRTLEYALAEDIAFTVSSTATAGAETWLGRGEAQADGGKTSEFWPDGSQSSQTYNSSNASSSGNLVGTNGGFETFTVANVPDGWTAVVGTAGTHFGSEATIFYAGAKALKIIGDGSTLTSLTLPLTVASLLPKTPYALTFANKMGVTPAAGIAVIDLIDGSNNVIADEAGNNNTKTVTLTGLGTTYVFDSVVFRLPDPIPSTVKLRIRQTTALTNTRVWYIDELQLKAMTRQYANYGPYFAIASGATAWSGDDTYNAAIANDRGGKFQSFAQKVFDIDSYDQYVLPSVGGGAQTIDEALFA